MKETIIGKRWKIVDSKLIGEGGNSRIFKVKDISLDSDDFFALKLMNHNNGKYKRYKDEITIQKRFSDQGLNGVIPIIDFNIPETPTEKDPIFIVMPIAETCEDKLGKEPDIEDVMKMILEVSKVLKSFIEKESSFLHRDIKPGNIFFYNDSWCLGDFGLATFSNKNNVTHKNERIGSFNFIAPEIYHKREFTEKGEVYALAKTLFSLIIDQRYPIPGPHSILDPTTTLDSYIFHPKVSQINNLMERATKNNPAERMSLDDFIEEVSLWLKEKNKNQNEINGLDQSLLKMLKDKDLRNKREDQDIDDQYRYLDKKTEDISQKLNVFIQESLNAQGFNIYSGTNDNVYFFVLDKNGIQLHHPYGEHRDCGLIYQARNRKKGFFYMNAGISLVLVPGSKVLVIAGIIFQEENGGIEEKWTDYHEVSLRSPKEEYIINTFIFSLKDKLIEFLPEFIEKI